jgi:hypothetical protein
MSPTSQHAFVYDLQYTRAGVDMGGITESLLLQVFAVMTFYVPHVMSYRYFYELS